MHAALGIVLVRWGLVLLTEHLQQCLISAEVIPPLLYPLGLNAPEVNEVNRVGHTFQRSTDISSGVRDTLPANLHVRGA